MEPIALVGSATLALQYLWGQGVPGAIAAFDLLMLCKDPAYEVTDRSVQMLMELALITEEGNIHESIKNIVLSSIEGEELDIQLVSPLL